VHTSSCTRDIAHNKESATVRNLKPEWWDAPVVQEVKVLGERKPVMGHDDDDDDDTVINKYLLNACDISRRFLSC